MKYKEIAEKYDTTINTVKSWKKRYNWSRKKGAHKNEKGCTQNTGCNQDTFGNWEDGTKETLQNDELSPAQQLFCIFYIRTFNATQSYQKAYKCSYETALRAGPRLLGNVGVKEEIERLKEIKRQQACIEEADIVELQMRIAFADMSGILKFNHRGVTLQKSEDVDMQLIKKVSEGRFGVKVEVEDRQKAISWLTKYFLMHPDDKYRAAFDRKRAEMDKEEVESDGFIEALKDGTAEIFAKAGDAIET